MNSANERSALPDLSMVRYPGRRSKTFPGHIDTLDQAGCLFRTATNAVRQALSAHVTLGTADAGRRGLGEIKPEAAGFREQRQGKREVSS